MTQNFKYELKRQYGDWPFRYEWNVHLEADKWVHKGGWAFTRRGAKSAIVRAVQNIVKNQKSKDIEEGTINAENKENVANNTTKI